MAGLIDIAPAVKSVPIRGSDVDVFGVGAGAIAALLVRFPELKTMLQSRSLGDAAALMTLPDRILDAVIAAGLGGLGDADVERNVGNLALGEKAELLAAVVTLTMPGGLDPFLKLVDALGLAATPAADADGKIKLRTTTSRKPSTP